MTPGFESAGLYIIFCYYSCFQLILSCFQNYLYRLKSPRFFSIHADKGKNKGKRLLPYSGNYASNLATTEYIMEFIGLNPLSITTIEKSEHRSTMNGVRISCLITSLVTHKCSFVWYKSPVSRESPRFMQPCHVPLPPAQQGVYSLVSPWRAV